MKADNCSQLAVKQAFDRFVEAFYKSLESCKNGRQETDNRLIVISCTLTSKIISHCNAAENLHWNGYPSESLIVLRSAFEAVVTMNYLVINPDKIDDYLNHSDLVLYKDMLLWLAYELVDPDTRSGTGKKPKDEVQELKKRLLNSNIHEKYKINIDSGQLDDFEFLAKKVPGTFCGIDTMAKLLKDKEPTVFTDEFWKTSRYIYNLGSQHTHPVWNQAKSFFAPGSTTPSGFFSPTMPLRDIVIIFLWMVYGWEKIGTASQTEAARLKNLLAEVISEIQKFDSTSD